VSLRGWVGVALVAAGLWLVYPPAGLVVAGLAMIMDAVLDGGVEA
jgi:hypothetical protein